MQTVHVLDKARVNYLLEAIAQLNEAEFAEFEVGFEQLALQRKTVVDAEMAQLVAKHRLPLRQQLRVRELLFKNCEGMLTDAEEAELDLYMDKMDQALEATSDELLALAEQRKHQQKNGDMSISFNQKF